MSENNLPKIIGNLKSSIDNASNEIKLTEIANIQVNTPVDSGTLRRSINGEITSKGNNRTITVGADGSIRNSKNLALVSEYAMKVEYEYKSYIRSTLNGDVSLIESILRKALKEI